MSNYRSVWRTERNVQTVNAQGALSLIRCKPGELKEMCGPYERCSRFVTAFTVRTDRKWKMRTESVRVYWTCVEGGAAVVEFVWFSKIVLWFEGQQIQMYRHGQLFVSLPEKRKPACLFLTPQENSTGNWLPCDWLVHVFIHSRTTERTRKTKEQS